VKGLKSGVLPDGPAALGHPTNEDLFVETPVWAGVCTPFCLVFAGEDVPALPLVGT
jgi:hypothetical protein